MEKSENVIGYYIWNFKRNMYWRPGKWGYTDNPDEAGIYTHLEALKIIREANIVKVEEGMIPVFPKEEN